jgi:hypothetical protein
MPMRAQCPPYELCTAASDVSTSPALCPSALRALSSLQIRRETFLNLAVMAGSPEVVKDFLKLFVKKTEEGYYQRPDALRYLLRPRVGLMGFVTFFRLTIARYFVRLMISRSFFFSFIHLFFRSFVSSFFWSGGGEGA